MIRQKRQNCREPPVDTACGNVEFCNALPEGVYLCTRPRCRVAARLEIARDVPPYFEFSQNFGQENITYLAKKVKSCCKNCSWVYIIRVYIDIKAT